MRPPGLMAYPLQNWGMGQRDDGRAAMGDVLNR